LASDVTLAAPLPFWMRAENFRPRCRSGVTGRTILTHDVRGQPGRRHCAEHWRNAHREHDQQRLGRRTRRAAHLCHHAPLKHPLRLVPFLARQQDHTARRRPRRRFLLHTVGNELLIQSGGPCKKLSYQKSERSAVVTLGSVDIHIVLFFRKCYHVFFQP